MSSLHDFVHHQLGAMPGPIAPHRPGENAPPAPKTHQGGPAAQSGTVSGNAKANAARKAGALKGEEFYTRQEAQSTENGWQEAPETVEHKLISKEMFPQG